MSAKTTLPVFVRRCSVCKHEVVVEWGPETHALAAQALREHIESHAKHELLRYVLGQHFQAETAF